MTVPIHITFINKPFGQTYCFPGAHFIEVSSENKKINPSAVKAVEAKEKLQLLSSV